MADTDAPPAGTVRVVVADDALLVREGVQRVLELYPDLEVVGVAADLDGLMAVVRAREPDVVVTDIRMPPTHSDEGIRAATRLRETSPGTGVVVLSQYAAPGYALELLAGGSKHRAYLLKERVSQPDQLAGAIREVARGGSVVDPDVVELLVAGARPADNPLSRLTPREREVLERIAQGKSNAGVAADLVLTERAVEKHINALFAKLGLSSEPETHRRVTAVLMYLASLRG
ncbi:response regulator transcription factor [Phytoactinopolyspora alkaliphila]|uniref:Response regulator transcription factor n=1 Tax=Phytoactinopolyspora alkaliphila TaxID=1783498 RepID=A0A6N9YH70_9ACTN|nr:response regulator transcription factor [Phytoactinopolyspora alkaliphila]NED94411.1 response regulator transcription factor [Phytoactinopolyspora alkaliphila]